MRVLLLLFLTSALVVGCECGTFELRPDQEWATRRVWREVYGITNDAPPSIEWVPVDELPGPAQGTTIGGWGIRIACGHSCSNSVRCGAATFTHELLHWKAWVEFGDVDPLHFRENWSLAKDAELAIFPDGDLCMN